MDYRLSLISLIWIGTLWSSQTAVVVPIIKELATTCASETHEVSDLLKTFSKLPEPVQEQLITTDYLSKGYVESKGLINAKPLFIAKTEVVELKSPYDAHGHRRPTRHPLNPFIIGQTEKEPVCFAYTYDAVVKVPKEEAYFVPHFFDHSTGKKYLMHPDHANEDSVRQFIGPNKHGVIVFFDHNEGQMHIGRLYEEIYNRKASCWDPECHKAKMLEGFNRPDLVNDFAPEFDPADPVTAISLDAGELGEPIDVSSHDARTLVKVLIYGYVQHLYKNYILEGRKSGRVLLHEFNERAMGLCNSFLFTPNLSTKELPVHLEGSARDLILGKDRSTAWILDGRALYTYSIPTKKQTTVCTLPNLGCRQESVKASPDYEKNDTSEKITRFILAPDEQYALLGGDQGSVLLVDVASNNCHVIEAMSGHAIVDMWWSEKNRIVLLSRSGVVKAYTLKIGTQDAYVETLMNGNQSNERATVSQESTQDENSTSAIHKPRIQLAGNARQINLTKDNVVAWILDKEALYTYSLKTLEQKLVAKMPQLPPRKDTYVYDSQTEEHLLTTECELIDCFVVSPHEQYALLGGSQGSVLLFDFARNTHHEIDVLADDGIKAIVWSQEDRIHIDCISGSYKEFTLHVLPDGSFTKTDEHFRSSKFESWEIDELIAASKPLA